MFVTCVFTFASNNPRYSSITPLTPLVQSASVASSRILILCNGVLASPIVSAKAPKDFSSIPASLRAFLSPAKFGSTLDKSSGFVGIGIRCAVVALAVVLLTSPNTVSIFLRSDQSFITFAIE